MKYLLSILLLNGLIMSVAVGAPNCANPSVLANNKHCIAVAGHSNQGSQGHTVIGSTGKTPDTAQTNSPLGSGSPVQNQIVQVHPLAPTVITGTSLVTLQTLTAKPHTFTGQNVQVSPVPTPTFTGTSAVPSQPIITAPPKTFTGQNVQVNPVPTPIIIGTSAGPLQPIITAPPKTFTGQNVQVNPVPTPIITGTSAGPLQPIITAPPKTFTGQNVQVNPVPTPIIIGTSAGPLQPIITAPPKTFTGQNIQVNPVPTPIITGTSAGPLQPITTVPPKTFAGQTQQQVYPVQAPMLIGYAAVPVKPVMNAPPKATVTVPPLLPNKTPMMVPSQPVMNVPPKATVTAPPLLPNKTPMLVPSQQPLTPVLITHVASSNLHPHVLLQQQMLHGSLDLKSLKPHIKGLPVVVYTDKNVHKTTYEKSTSINSKGFHLTVLGVKEPTFVDTSPLPVAVKPDDIIFNFGFASAEIHRDQLSLVDKIIEKHSKNGKRIILMGETDGFGSETYNKHLAVLRANKIIDELKARGAKVDDVEIRILVRCCRKDHPNKETLAETSEQRITWVHFQ